MTPEMLIYNRHRPLQFPMRPTLQKHSKRNANTPFSILQWFHNANWRLNNYLATQMDIVFWQYHDWLANYHNITFHIQNVFGTFRSDHIHKKNGLLVCILRIVLTWVGTTRLSMAVHVLSSQPVRTVFSQTMWHLRALGDRKCFIGDMEGRLYAFS